MDINFSKKKLFIVLIALSIVTLTIYLYLASSLFMKTTLISDWSGQGTACYYFGNGIIVAHQIKRVYNGGKIKEGRFQETVNRYRSSFPAKIRFISKSRVSEIKKWAFEELDVMNKEMPSSDQTDATYTTTFYKNFRCKKYYSFPAGYLGILTK